MRRSIVPIAVVLALATGAVLGQAHSLLAPIAVSGDGDLSARAGVVRRFYTAVDDTLASGDARELERVVAVDYVEHADRPGGDRSRIGLVRYLASLRAAYPAVQLAPLDLVAQHDRVVARVRVDGATGGDFLGMPMSGNGIWSGIDIFRVEGDQIAEHWSDQGDRFLLEPLAETSFTQNGTAGNVVTMDRRFYAAGASLQEIATAGPTLLFVESGALTVDLDYRSTTPATLWRNATEVQLAQNDVSPGSTATLKTGDAIAMPTGALLTTRNGERNPATVIALTIGESASPETASEAHPVALTTGITDQVLAGGGSVILATGPLRLAFGRATLAPRSEFALHPTTGAELVAVDSGSLAFVLPQGSAWLHTPGHSAVTAHEYEEIPAGQGVAVAPSATVAYRNDGSSPLVVLVVTVQPAP